MSPSTADECVSPREGSVPLTAPRSSYDVIVVGASLAALGAGALLSRRGFRVAVIGHDTRPETYGYDGLNLRRDLAAVSFIDTPAFRRVAFELALMPTVRRRLVAIDPVYQVTLPTHRIDVSPRTEHTLSELRREFALVQRPVEDFHATLERANSALDLALATDLAWPPTGFFERREAARLARSLPYGPDGRAGDALTEFASNHPFRTYVDAQARFATSMDPDRMTALCRVRLHGSGLRGAWLAEGGTDGLKRLFADKVLQYGGEVRMRDRVDRVVTRHGRAVAVVLAGTDEVLGCNAVVTSLSGHDAQRLTGAAAGRAWSQRLQSVRPRYYRYAINVVIPESARPMGMSQRVFSVVDPARPLAEENLLAIEATAADEQKRVVLTAVALLPRASVDEGGGYLRRVRERVLRAMGELIPYLQKHATVVDSPHDGLPLDDRARGTEVTLDVRWSGAGEPMEAVDHVEDPGFLGVCGLPCQTDTAAMFLCNRQVVPGLGAEGEFLAALTVARSITRTDPSKERLRRELWSRGADVIRAESLADRPRKA